MTSLARFATALAALSLLGLGCDGPLPTQRDAGVDAGLDLDARVFPDGTVFCETDADCDDGVSCTEDSCLAAGICRNAVQPSACDDGVFCNGREICDPQRGCLPAPVRETCNDDNVCTIDRCDEETDSCEHFPRDLDGDGDVDFFCVPAGEEGGDCDDRDPTVSSLRSEVCDDFVDNDCDGEIDEGECGGPPNDVCADPLDISAGGSFLLNTSGANPDYTTSCSTVMRRDLVASFTLTEARSVSIEGQGEFFTVYLSLRSECDDLASEIACQSGFPGLLRRRSLEPGTYYLIAAAGSEGEIALDVRFGDPVPPAENDTCASPTVVDPAAGPIPGSFVEVTDAASLSCGASGWPDLFYTFTTTAEQDVEITALAASGDRLAWALRSTCSDASSTLRCAYGGPATGRIHQLPAGTYYVAVEGREGIDFTLEVRSFPPTPAPPGDSCADPLPLTVGTPATGSLTAMQDDIDLVCGFNEREVVYTFSLDEASDVTVQLDVSGSGTLAVGTTCDATGDVYCSSTTPTRARLRNLAAGTYYVIAEASPAGGYSLRVDATTPPTVPVEVTGNEDCASAHDVPATGGFFHGSTVGMVDDFTTATCSSPSGPDAVYRLVLTEEKRVVMSTDGASFDTILHLHRDTCAAGGDIACDDDAGEGNASLIDRVLPAGTYYIVVDGWAGRNGEYFLEVVVSDP